MKLVKPQTLLRQSIQQLTGVYDSGEADAISRLLLYELLQIDRAKLMINEEIAVADQQLLSFEKSIGRLLRHEPVQHILGYAYFYGRTFRVSPDVLIPRQETEELIALVIKEHPGDPLTVLDIGTGSGCIPITLARELPEVEAYGVDVSEGALSVARENARNLGAKVDFSLLDILNEEPAGLYDVIISNPPYITFSEKAQMHENVISYEPSLALFVPDEDPLRFYRRITNLSQSHLRPGGRLYFEINEHFGDETRDLLIAGGFVQVSLIQDLNGKDRIVSGIKS